MGAAKWLSENAKRYPGREELTAACMKATGISRDHAVKMVRSGKTDLFCSRCGAPLEWDEVRGFRCSEGCRKVVQRWWLAFQRSASGWGEYTHKCSRCGTNLLGAPPYEWFCDTHTFRPALFWCPGCGDVD